MAKTRTNHHVRIPCGLSATAKCQGDAGRRWIYGQTVAKDDSCSLGLGASSGRRRRERGGLALGIIRGAREAAAASTSARRAASACFSAAVAARFDDLTSSRAASSFAARRSLVAWAAAAAIIVPKNGCNLQALLLRSCGRGGRTAGGPVGDALGVLLLDQLPERVDALEQRCPGLRHLPLLRAPATAVDVRSHVQRQSVDVDDRNAGRQGVEGQLQLFLALH